MTEQFTKETLFSVGEIAVLCNATVRTYFNDMECTVIKGPGEMRQLQDDGSIKLIYGYSVLASNGVKIACEPYKLKKRKPPREDLQIVRWDTCPWQPEEIRV